MGTWRNAKDTVAWAEQKHRDEAKQRKQEKAAAEAAERIANGRRK